MSRRPRVLMVGPTPPPHHGPAIWTRMVLDAESLRERFELLHLDTSDRRDLGNIGRLDLRNVQLALAHLVRMCWLGATRRPDLVHVQPSQNALAFLRDAGFVAIARLFGARVVLHLHGEAFGEFHRSSSRPVRALIRATCRLAHRVWVLGEDVKRVFDGLAAPEARRSVPNGIPARMRAGIEAGSASAAGGDDRPFRFLHLGQVARTKGVDRAIDAVVRLIETGEDVELVIAGGWGSREDERVLGARLDDLAARPEVGDRIRHVGVVLGEEKAQLLRSADAFVLLSRFPPGEGQPLAILEAMCAGVPVVAADRGAIAETLGRGECGVLVGEDSFPEDELRALVADPGRRDAMAAAARARFAAEYTETAFLTRFADALDEALRA